MLGVSVRVCPKTVAPKVLARFTDKGDGTPSQSTKQEGVVGLNYLRGRRGSPRRARQAQRSPWASTMFHASGVATVSPLAKNSSASATASTYSPRPREPSVGGGARCTAREDRRPEVRLRHGATPDTKRLKAMFQKAVGRCRENEPRRKQRDQRNHRWTGLHRQGRSSMVEVQRDLHLALDGAPPDEACTYATERTRLQRQAIR